VDIVEPWSPFISAARANLGRLQFPDNISPDWIKKHLDLMRCSPNYPDTVAHNVTLARELCVAGCLFYELFTTSIQYSAAACESALKHKFVDVLPLPLRLVRTAEGRIEEKVLSDRLVTYQLVDLVAQGWRLPAPHAKFRPTLGYLIHWGVRSGLVPEGEERWYEHRLRMRNTIAHGHDMIVAPSWALGNLQQTIVTLNRLFPDADTSTYDQEAARQRESRDREWASEVEGMLRYMPEAEAVDGDDDDGSPPQEA
jgi:hypothetical protein